MKGQYWHHGRVIVRTRICWFTRRTHWHAAVVTKNADESTTGEGMDLRFGTFAAWFWLVTGKPWFAVPEGT